MAGSFNPWGSFGASGGAYGARSAQPPAGASGWDTSAYDDPFKDPNFAHNPDLNIYDQNGGEPALGLFGNAYGDSNFNSWLHSYQTRNMLSSQQQAYAATHPGASGNWFNFLSNFNPYSYYQTQVSPRNRGETPGMSPFVKFLG